MIHLGFIKSSFFVDCSKLEYIVLYRFMIWLKYLNKLKLTPDFILIKSKKYIVFSSSCKILDLESISVIDIKYILKILKILEMNNIKLNYLEQVPFLKDNLSGKIYLINLFWASGELTNNLELNYDIKNIRKRGVLIKNNHYLISKFYNLDLNLMNNIDIIICLLIDKYTETIVINILNIIKFFNKYIFKKTFMLTIIEKYYDRIFNVLKFDTFNKYIFIKVDNDYNYNKQFYDNLLELENHILDYFITINVLEFQEECKIIETIHKILEINSSNFLATKIFGNLDKKMINQINKFSFNNRNILNYSINDINFKTLKFNKKRASKEFFIKNKVKLKFEYDFNDRQFPKLIKMNYIILDKLAINYFLKNNLKNFYNKGLIDKIGKTKSEILLSMLCFYNKTKVI